MTHRFSPDFWSNRGRFQGGIDRLSSRLVERLEPSFSWDDVTDLPHDGEAAPADYQEDGILEIDHRAGGPVRLSMPRNYEPNYPYPLIVWLPSAGSCDPLSLMPRISPQNYLALSLNEAKPSVDRVPGEDRGFRSETELAAFAEELEETVRHLRREYHVHTERVFAAGIADGAPKALELLLHRPEWFGGAVCLDGLADLRDPLPASEKLRGRRVLIASGTRHHAPSAAALVETSRKLHAAGIEVSTLIAGSAHEPTTTGGLFGKPGSMWERGESREECDGDREPAEATLRRIDHWLMEGIAEAV